MSQYQNAPRASQEDFDNLSEQCVENNSEESYFPFKEKDSQSGWTLFYCGKCRKPFWRSRSLLSAS